MADPKAEGASVPPAAKGSWASFLKSITSFSGDIASLTAPPFILSSTSLTEYSAYWTEHPGVFVAPTKEKDPAKRALLVLKWFLTTLKQQYSSRSETLGSEKKPLNPFLGELFLGHWDGDADEKEIGTTQLVSEQVSHHPPVTAYATWNSKHGVVLQGYNGQKASISKTLTITVKQVGHAVLHLKEFNEDYLITLPNLHIEGVYTGAPFVELNSSSHIVSSSGYTAKIDYSGRGWITGKKNSFTATLAKSTAPKDIIYTVDGQWTGAFQLKEGKGGKAAKIVDEWDPSKTKLTVLTVAPIEQQDALESRRAWQHVASAIQKGDMEAVSLHKGEIENRQREMRKKEKEDGTSWERRYFTKVEKRDAFEKLAKHAGLTSVEAEKTGGVWQWDGPKAAKANPSFSHQS